MKFKQTKLTILCISSTYVVPEKLVCNILNLVILQIFHPFQTHLPIAHSIKPNIFRNIIEEEWTYVYHINSCSVLSMSLVCLLFAKPFWMGFIYPFYLSFSLLPQFFAFCSVDSTNCIRWPLSIWWLSSGYVRTYHAESS